MVGRRVPTAGRLALCKNDQRRCLTTFDRAFSISLQADYYNLEETSPLEQAMSLINDVQELLTSLFVLLLRFQNRCN